MLNKKSKIKICHNYNNWHKSTIADFLLIELPIVDRLGKPDYISNSGSLYWIFCDKVLRYSDHWGVVGNCYWTINYQINNNNGEKLLGLCYYKDFQHFILEKNITCGISYRELFVGQTINFCHSTKDRQGKVYSYNYKNFLVNKISPAYITGTINKNTIKIKKSTMSAIFAPTSG